MTTDLLQMLSVIPDKAVASMADTRNRALLLCCSGDMSHSAPRRRADTIFIPRSKGDQLGRGALAHVLVWPSHSTVCAAPTRTVVVWRGEASRRGATLAGCSRVPRTSIRTATSDPNVC